MTAPDDERLERLEELLVEQATQGLDAARQAELDVLLDAVDLDDPEAFERAAAALDLVFVGRSGAADEPLPADLAARIEADAARWLPEGAERAPLAATPPGGASAPTPTYGGPSPAGTARPGPARGPVLTLLAGAGWAAAAAAALALFLLDGRAERRRIELVGELARLEERAEQSRAALRDLNGELVDERERADAAQLALAEARRSADELELALSEARTEAETASSELAALVAEAEDREAALLDQVAQLEELLYQPPAEVRLERLLARADDVVRVPWSSTPDPLVEGSGVGGEVIWSDSLQEGYMVFEAMRSNRELEQQYQLWIFAANQSPETPVDGGVFDVDATERRLVVPIDPKLAVESPSLFAVTLEKPGGVVVSSRDRLLLLAEV